MANKNPRRMEEIRKRENQKLYQKQTKWLGLYPIFMLLAAVITVLLFSVNWAAIYNTDIGGNEVAITGYNCLSALLTNQFTSADKSVGDMAVPFYYYAKTQCESLSAATLVALIVLIFAAILSIVTLITKKHDLIAVNTAMLIIETIALIVAYCIALSLNGGKILPVYCSGNPACSIKSTILLPAIISLLGSVVGALGAVKFAKARKLIS